jgi:hypothetical protein
LIPWEAEAEDVSRPVDFGGGLVFHSHTYFWDVGAL